ncbi:glycine/D-amino acid oxidase-like deaminating enzyme [Rhodococcus sp. 27YEA15]|uniref:NAD(P)/FAD-dependent oxidoreductase n=1 Tax=Rhodococcus sp. 27YEA15 TaxID=3156259 RepID=UPI003C7DB3B4
MNDHDDTSILVVGAGIVGASIAYRLARAGHRVTVVERDGAAAGVTGDSFAWIGLAKSAADVYSQTLRRTAADEFSRLESELAGTFDIHRFDIHRGGAITWEATETETRRFVDTHRALGHPIELLTGREVLVREPGLRAVPAVAAYAPGDGGVDPVAFTRALLHSAEKFGATVHFGSTVQSLITDGARVCGVATSDGPISASTTVLAAGTAIPALATSSGAVAEVDASPCCLIRYSTPRPLVNGILSTPDFEVRQGDDTTLIAAEDVPAGFTGDPRALAIPTTDAIRRLLVGGEQIELIDAVVADRPVPRDGRPLLRHAAGVSGLYLAAVHPAIILAGAIGAQVAHDLTRV